MAIEFAGLHHVTAIASDPQANVDFYTGVLGLRLVKKTVNFDDPLSYHLYYGDAVGNPGTLITFFSWPDRPPGRTGPGHAGATSYAAPEGSQDYWTHRLVEHEVPFEQPVTRFGETVMAFKDPDGLPVELVFRTDHAAGGEAWAGSPVPAEHAIVGLAGVALLERSGETTATFLTRVLGFQKVGEEHGRIRYGAGESFADVLEVPGGQEGRIAAGVVHHVAWRAPDAETQEAWRAALSEHEFLITEVRERVYFDSIYFQEPGGVIFEIATDPPGFTVDENEEHLGKSLKLPPWLEEHRERIEQFLSPVSPPRESG